MTSIPEYLTSSHAEEICHAPYCPEAVKRNPETGRFFITMGHPGFNNRANNGAGYATDAAARRAIRNIVFGPRPRSWLRTPEGRTERRMS